MTIATEECAEVAQRISKALRFGMDERQPGQALTNRERIYREYWDLRATLGLMGIDAWENSDLSKRLEEAKVRKVEQFLEYSRTQGTLA